MATHRVIRERTLQQILFPGRDGVTFGNRVWELARDLPPVGPYWVVQRRMLSTGVEERFLAITDVGYREAEVRLGLGAFDRKPVELLKPNHVEHDLELADFGLSLLPRRATTFQPTVRGRPSGEPIAIQEPYLPTKWRWRHVSVFRRLVVLYGPKDAAGKFDGKPKVFVSIEPDAILETDTFNCTRYFVEWDRGTESLISPKDKATILRKLFRASQYFFEPPPAKVRRHRHWATERSHYLAEFAGTPPRRPKLLLVTRSAKRAENMLALAARVFANILQGDRLGEFVEALTIEEAREKLAMVTARAEAAEPARELPWLAEVRALERREATENEELRRKAEERMAAEAERKRDEEAAAARRRPEDGQEHFRMWVEKRRAEELEKLGVVGRMKARLESVRRKARRRGWPV